MGGTRLVLGVLEATVRRPPIAFQRPREALAEDLGGLRVSATGAIRYTVRPPSPTAGGGDDDDALDGALAPSQIRPWRTALATAWVRERALSLITTSWRTFFTVRSE